MEIKQWRNINTTLFVLNKVLHVFDSALAYSLLQNIRFTTLYTISRGLTFKLKQSKLILRYSMAVVSV